MIGKTRSGRKRHLKMAFGVSARSYSSTLAKLLYGIGQGSTPATDLCGIIHGLVMNTPALSFIGILIISVSKQHQHERIGEGFINDTGMGTTNPHSTAIAHTSTKAPTIEDI
jgi:hypothetical protein